MTPTPAYWELLCTRLLRTTPRLARELWQAYCAIYPHTSVTTRFQLDRMLTPPTITAMEQRLAHLEALLPPSALLEVSGRLSPEGAPRREDIVAFEERLLRYVHDGHWI